MNRHCRRAILRAGIGTLLAAMGPVGTLLATSDSWDGSTDALWSTTTNWLTDPAVVPGTGDTATFDGAGNGNTTIDLGGGVTIGTILFDTAGAAAYTVGAGAVNSQSLTLDNGGAITVNATVAANQLFNSALVLGTDGTAQTFTLTNNSATNSLTVAGGITGSTGAGVKTLAVAGAGNTTLSGTIGNGTTGTVALTKSGAGTLTLSVANTFSGGVTLNSGKLLVGNAAGAGTGTITLNAGTFGASGAQTINNKVEVLTGNSATIGGGTGTLTLGGTLTGGGSLELTTNTLVINGNVASRFTGSITSAVEIQTTSGVNQNVGALNLSNAAITLQSGGGFRWSTGGSTGQTATFALGSLSGTAGTLGLTSGSNKTAAFWIGTLNTNTTYGGTIINGNSGAASPTSVVKVGSGTLILNGAAASNTMTGGITIRGGTLQVGDGTATAGGFSTASNALTFSDTGTFNYMGSTAGSTQGMAALTFNGGAGTLQSTNNGGTSGLTFSNLVARGAGATGNFVVSGGTNGTDNKIVFTQIAGAAPTTGALIDKGYYFGGSDFAAYDAGSYVRALAYGTDTDTSAVDTIAAGTHVKLTSTPAAQAGISLLTLNLAGSGVSWANDAAQTLTLSGGGLIKSGGGTVGTISGGTALVSGATELVVRTDTSTDLLDIQTNITSGSSGGLTKSGAGTLTLSGASNAYTGLTRVNEGTMVISGGYNGSSAFTVNNSATLTVSGTVTSNQNATFNMLVGNRSGDGVLNVNSGGTLTLTIGNFNTALAISNSAAGGDAGNGTVNVAGTLNTNGDVTVGLGGTQTGTLNINSGGIFNIGTTTLRWMKIGQFDAVNGVVNLAAGGTLNLNFNSLIRFSTNNGDGTNVFNQSGNVTVWSGNGTGTTGSVNDGAIDMQHGTTTTRADNTYNLNGGTLLVNRVFSTGTTATRTFNFNGGTLAARSASAATFFNLGAGNARANVRNGGAIIDTNGFNVAIGSALQHSNVSGDNATDGGLTKIGVGTLTLSVANTYTGNTGIVMGNTTGLNTASTLNLSFAANQVDIINNTSNSSALILGGSLASNATAVLGGGQLTLTGVATSTNTQRFNGMTVGTGGNNIVFANNATANTIALDVGAISRTVGGTLHITQPTGTVSATNGVQTSTGTASTILTDANGTAFATVGGTAAAAGDWAAKDATNAFIVGGSTIGGFYTTSTDAATFSGNADVTTGFTATAGTTVNSIRMNNNTAQTLNINSSGDTTVSTGGVLFGSTGNSVITGTGTARLVAGAGKELVFINTSTGTPQLNAVIADSASGASSVTYRALQLTSGNGQFAIGGAGNTYTGNTYIESGRVGTNVSTAFGTGAGANVYVNGNTNGQAYLFGGTFANHFYLIGNGWNETGGPYGALRLQGATVSGQVTLLGNATISDHGGTGTISGVIDDGGNAYALTVNGNGTLILTNANTYTGATTISAGTLRLGNAGTTGSLVATGTISIASNATLAFNRTNPVTQGVDFGTITTTTGVLTQLGTGALTLTGSNSIQTLNVNNATGTVDIGAGSLTLSNGGGSTIQSSTGGTINGTGGGTIVLGSNLGDVGTANGTTLTINAAITGIAANGFEVYGGATGGTVVLTNNANTFAGNVTIDGGTLSVSNIGNTGSTTSQLGAGTTIFMQASGAPSVLKYTGTGESTNRIISLNGTTGGATIDQSGASGNLLFTANFATPGAGSKTLTLQGSTAGTGEISGVISNNSGINTTAVTKAGTGTWTLSGANTYTGATNIDAGTLLVSGSISGSITTVNNTGTLGGAGGTTGAVTVNNGGTLSPGASIGQLNTVGDVTLNAGATFKLEIDTTTPATDLLAITGNLSLAGTNDVVLTITDLTPAAFTSGTLTFITYTPGGWNGGLFTYNSNVIADDGLLTVGSNQFTLDYNFGGNSVALLAVPEPGSAVSLLGGVGLLLGLQRFRRRIRG